MKRKVLHVSYGGLGNGGVTSVIIGIVSKLYAEFDFGCVVFSKKCERESEFCKYGKLYRLNCYRNRNFFSRLVDLFVRPFIITLGVYKICKKEHYDVIHCHNGKDMALCLLGAKLAHVKKRIAHSHNAKSTEKKHLFHRMYDSFFWYLVRLFATDFVGCSQKACEDFFKQKKCTVIYNSIDLNGFHWENKENKTINFVHVGRYEYQKNQKFVIEVFEKIRKVKPYSVLRLVGFGHDEKKLRQIVSSKKLDDVVHFVDGHCASISDVLASSDYMIFPSYFEGFGIVLLEAQASGCFCFASDACPPETNVGYMEQYSLSLGSDAWCENILLHLDSECPDMRNVVQERIKKFDSNNISKRYKELYAD